MAANYTGSDFIGKAGLEAPLRARTCTAPPASRKSRPTPAAAPCAPCAARCRCRATICCSRSTRACRTSPSACSATGAARWWRSSRPPAGVLALVSKPGFDPNLFVDGIDPQNWEMLNNSPDHPLNNRALQGVYPPGSTFKPFMALAGARAAASARPRYTIADPGYFILGSAATASATGRSAATAWSTCTSRSWCPATPTTTAWRTSWASTTSTSFIGQFGFGKRRPASTSTARSAACCRRRNGRCSASSRSGSSATPSRWASARATTWPPRCSSRTPPSMLANDGVMFRPHIVRHVQNSQTNELTSIEVEPIGTVPLQPGQHRSGDATPWST